MFTRTIQPSWVLSSHSPRSGARKTRSVALHRARRQLLRTRKSVAVWAPTVDVRLSADPGGKLESKRDSDQASLSLHPSQELAKRRATS